MEKQKSPTSAERGRADRMLTPLQRAMTKARSEIIKHSQDLGEAGIPENQIENAANIAGERAKHEFEQRQTTDPIYLVETALREMLPTIDDPEQVKHIEAGLANLESARTLWQEKLNAIRAKTKLKGAPETRSKEEIVRGEIIIEPENFVQYNGGNVEVLPTHPKETEYLSGNQPSQIEKTTLEKTLVALGSPKGFYLDMLKDKRNLPEGANFTAYDSFTPHITNFPTNISGVTATIKMGDRNRGLSLTFQPEAVAKALP